MRRMKTMGWVLVMGGATLLAGCYSVDYDTKVVLPEKGSTKVAVATVDERPHVLNHKNPTNYVGIIRGGFGNPFDRHTDDGKPLADEFSQSMVDSLADSGFAAIVVSDPPAPNADQAMAMLKQSGASRLVLLELREWQSDTYVNPTMNVDYTFHVYDASGKELATITEKKDEDFHGGNIFNPVGGSNDKVVAYYQGKIQSWFSDPKVEAALQD
ncbi:MAG TPA: hypothetical protein VGM16_02590 [Gammaproteobacteria bacterium]